MRRRPGVLALGLVLTLTGCAGRWMPVSRPPRGELADGYPRDLRVTLQRDSMVVLRGAVLRGDSLVQASPPRGVALADVRSIERWQSGGERTVGTGLLAAVGALAVLFFYTLSRIPET